MFLCDLADERIERLKQGWGEIGDSIVVVGGDGLWNCHVHTNDIGAAIEAALDLDGRPRQIRVTDLFEEVAAEHAVREAAMMSAAVELPAVTCAVVAVSSGPGISELFRELGVQAVVTGGQTLNPSTAELLEAVERVNADQVVVLPGNKNIIPVAEQLDALTPADGARRADPVDARGARRADGLRPRGDAPRSTRPRCATPPRRSPPARSRGRCGPASSEAGPVAEGDWMGSCAATGSSPSRPTSLGAATALLDRLVDDDRELVTVITGADADEATTAALERVAGRQPSRRRGRGARRRPAAVPVPLRRRVRRR